MPQNILNQINQWGEILANRYRQAQEQFRQTPIPQRAIPPFVAPRVVGALTGQEPWLEQQKKVWPQGQLGRLTPAQVSSLFGATLMFHGGVEPSLDVPQAAGQMARQRAGGLGLLADLDTALNARRFMLARQIVEKMKTLPQYSEYIGTVTNALARALPPVAPSIFNPLVR